MITADREKSKQNVGRKDDRLQTRSRVSETRKYMNYVSRASNRTTGIYSTRALYIFTSSFGLMENGRRCE